MAAQMYFITLQGEFTEQASRDLQMAIRQRGGFILMVTRNGQVAALDDSQAPLLAKHPLVKSIGGVMLNPRGVAADRLQRIFAENLSKQLDVSGLGR